MSKLFNKLNSVERGFSVNEETWSGKSSLVQPSVKVAPQKNIFNKRVTGLVIVTCLIVLVVGYKVMMTIRNIETSNAITSSQLNASVEQVAGQLSVLSLKLKDVQTDHGSAMLKNDGKWNDKFNHLQSTLDNQVNKSKIELVRARLQADRLKTKNQDLEAQIKQLRLKIEEVKTGVVQ